VYIYAYEIFSKYRKALAKEALQDSHGEERDKQTHRAPLAGAQAAGGEANSPPCDWKEVDGQDDDARGAQTQLPNQSKKVKHAEGRY